MAGPAGAKRASGCVAGRPGADPAGRKRVAYENVLVEVRDAVAVVTVNRPAKLNALDAATIEDLDRCFSVLAGDAGVRGVVLTGAGERAFVAGADVEELRALSGEGARAV